MLHIDERDAGREVVLAVGESMELCLRENPTTGYRWHLDWQGEPVGAPLDDDYTPSTDRPGSGGLHCWRFQAVGAGKATLTARLRRQWEQGAAETLTFPVRVTP